MAVTAPALGEALRAIVGAEGVRDDPAGLSASAVDGVTPRWVAAPTTLDAVARTLALAHDERLTVVPRGSGTALDLGHPLERVDVVLDLRRLDAIVEYEPDDLTVTVQAGCTAGALAARLAPHRQALPLDPPGWHARTLGGVAATASSGPLRLRYGTMRDLLLGVRFVQPDGVTTWGGARVVKSVTGYDVPKLMVGALGTLGVLAELTLRLHPMPEHEATWLASFPAAAQAQDCVAALLDSTLQPNRVEILDGRALAACSLPVSASALAISIGTVEPAVRAQQVTLTAIVQRSRGAMQTMGASFWRAYDALGGALAVRVGTVPSRVATTMAVLATVLPDLAITGSAALGSLRAAGPAPDGATLAAALTRLRDAVADVDGGAIVERAPRAVRAGIDPWGPSPALELMRAIKQEFDPRGVLNPGRFVGRL